MILDEIAQKTVVRVGLLKKKRDFFSVRREAERLPVSTEFPFEKALLNKELSFICEVKKASPSKGIIAGEFPYLDIAVEYETAGADAVSVLTEPDYFMGNDLYLTQIGQKIKLPLLRKDFTIDAYQIYESKLIGASAVLLICALLEEERLKEYREIAKSLGLSALVEAHTEQEVESALRAGAEIVGVNNRNLKTFEVDLTTSKRLRGLVPKEVAFVSESGITTAADILQLKEMGVNGVLIGETFMRSRDKKRALQVLKGEIPS